VKVTNMMLNITSDQPEKMLAFYRDVVGLSVRPDMGDHAVDAGGAVLGFDGHSNTRGAAKEPTRFLVDLFVEDVRAEQARLEAQGVSFIRRLGKEYWGGIISTFLDPDGNYVQIIEYRPEMAEMDAELQATA
jgi:predicted enzyme related to lactoylglutathione lyase